MSQFFVFFAAKFFVMPKFLKSSWTVSDSPVRSSVFSVCAGRKRGWIMSLRPPSSNTRPRQDCCRVPDETPTRRHTVHPQQTPSTNNTTERPTPPLLLQLHLGGSRRNHDINQVLFCYFPPT